MIVALEGPDRAGKSTLLEQLRPLLSAVYVPRLPMPEELRLVMPYVEQRHMALWTHLYDPSRLYVCDRHPAVTERVYSRVHRRACADVSALDSEIRVVYLRPSIRVLEERLLASEGAVDPLLTDTVRYYDEVVAKFPNWLYCDPASAVQRIKEWWDAKNGSMSVRIDKVLQRVPESKLRRNDGG